MNSQKTTNILLTIIIIILLAPVLILVLVYSVSTSVMNKYQPDYSAYTSTPTPRSPVINAGYMDRLLRSSAEAHTQSWRSGYVALTEYNDDACMCIVQLYHEDITADSAKLAVLGDESSKDHWNNLLYHAVELQQKVQESADRISYKPIEVIVQARNYNDTNSVLVQVERGEITYNVLNSASA